MGEKTNERVHDEAAQNKKGGIRLFRLLAILFLLLRIFMISFGLVAVGQRGRCVRAVARKSDV